MKTQISRNGFAAERRYSGVYQQQGRIILDADWNELVDLLKSRLADVLGDAVASGAPRAGGLGVLPDGRIRPGRIYADGVDGVLPGTDPVAVEDQGRSFPEAPEPPPGTAHVLYADLWDRTVTAREEGDGVEESGGERRQRWHLRDPGLHGADTTTRTERLVQVKWCPEGVDPEDPAQNPRHGDARLSARFRSDPGPDVEDPCAPVLSGEEIRAGNELLRVEIHAVEWSGDARSGPPAGVTVKWSRENGAEEHRRDAGLPGDFVRDGAAYELFDGVAERHPGVHQATGFTPRRGTLFDGWPDAPPDPDALPYVRRWDGFAVLARNGGAWTVSDSGGGTGGGDGGTGITVEGGELRLDLEEVLVALELEGRTFVAGDFWQVPIRRALYEPGLVLADAVAPAGIVHHYVRLAAVAADGSVTPAGERRLAFPPLTDLDSGDVGYGPGEGCTLLAGTATVQEALDRLCALTADDLPFDPRCDRSIYAGETVATVADALRLLCDLEAREVAYDGQPGVTNVHEALDELFERPVGGGCEVTVGEGGQFETLETAIEQLTAQGRSDLCLCLLPGAHDLEEGLSVEIDQGSLTISACARGVDLLAGAPVVFRGLAFLRLQGLAIDFGQRAGVLVEKVPVVEVLDCRIAGSPRDAEGLLTVTGADRVRVEGCVLAAAFLDGDTGEREAVREVFEGFDALAGLFAERERRDLFEERTREAATALAGAGASDRRSLRRAARPRVARLVEEGRLGRATGEEITSFLEGVAAPNPTATQVRTALDAIRRRIEAAEAGPSAPALALDGGEAAAVVVDNQITGSVVLGGPPTDEVLVRGDLVTLGRLLSEGDAPVRLVGEGTLQMHRNRLDLLALGGRWMEQIENVVEGGGTEVLGVYADAHLGDNRIDRGGGRFLARSTAVAGNRFLERFEDLAESRDLGAVIGFTALYSLNRGLRTDNIPLFNVTPPIPEGQLTRAHMNEIIIMDLAS